MIFVLQYKTDNKKKERKKREINQMINSKTGYYFLRWRWQFWAWRETWIKDFRVRFLDHFQFKSYLICWVFSSKRVNTQRTKDHFSPHYQVYHREKSIKSADIKKQLLVCPSLFPLRKQLGELVAQAQMSLWDLNTEALIWKTNRHHVEHNIYLKHCKTDTMIQKTPKSHPFGTLSIDFSAWF